MSKERTRGQMLVFTQAELDRRWEELREHFENMKEQEIRDLVQILHAEYPPLVWYAPEWRHTRALALAALWQLSANSVRREMEGNIL